MCECIVRLRRGAAARVAALEEGPLHIIIIIIIIIMLMLMLMLLLLVLLFQLSLLLCYHHHQFCHDNDGNQTTTPARAVRGAVLPRVPVLEEDTRVSADTHSFVSE